MMPPNALGVCTAASIDCDLDVSNEEFNVFLVSNVGILHHIIVCLDKEDQFILVMISSSIARRFLHEEEPPLSRLLPFYTLHSFPPFFYPNLNQTA
jgi:hypothetical protein